MLVTIIVPKATSCGDLEPTAFAFADRLKDYCASITSCLIAIRRARAHHIRHRAFTVKVTLSVFGQDVHLHGSASAQQCKDALTKALGKAFNQALIRLEPIWRAHAGCGCGKDTAIRDVMAPDPNQGAPDRIAADSRR